MEQEHRDKVNAAIEAAIGDLLRVREGSSAGVLNFEPQARAAMYASLKGQGCNVDVEAAYPGRSRDQRCDLRVCFPSGGEVWIEMKTAWYVRGKGWNNKSGEQRDRCKKDIRKLRAMPEGVSRLFVLFGFFDHVPDTHSCRVVEEIFGLFQGRNPVLDSGCRDFQWQNAVEKLRVWAWAV